MTEKDFYISVAFIIIPFSSFLLCFVNDKDKSRKQFVNWFLIGNAIFFLSPLTYAYIATLSNGNMWNENGPGTVLWFYLLLLPFCYIVQVILLVLKIFFLRKSKV
jgi:hypothetical protein